jgi:hypothetical protein
MNAGAAATVAVGLLAIGVTFMVAKRRWIAIAFYSGAGVVGTFLMDRWLERSVWVALALVAMGTLILYEVQLRARRQSRIETLREKETEGRTVALLLYLVCAMGRPPSATQPDYSRVAMNWIDSARSLLRDAGGARFVDIFNATAGVPVELPDPIADGTWQEQQAYRMVSRHLTKMRELIHELEQPL